MTKNLKYYMSLPYTIRLRPDEDGDWVAKIDELEGCSAHGATREEAVQRLTEMKELWIADCLEAGDPIPEPAKEEPLPSGKWLQRVPRSLHAKLAALAKREEVSLNQLVTSVLSQFVGANTLPIVTARRDIENTSFCLGQGDAVHQYGRQRTSGDWVLPLTKTGEESGLARLIIEHLRATTPTQIKTSLEATQNAAKKEQSSHRIGHC